MSSDTPDPLTPAGLDAGERARLRDLADARSPGEWKWERHRHTLGHDFIPEGAAFGDTVIQLGDRYENCEADCAYIEAACAALPALLAAAEDRDRAEADAAAARAEAAETRARMAVLPDEIAAYLLDRADQYQDGSGCWVALADAAADVARGEAQAAAAHGELDAGLMARIARMEKEG